MRGMREGSAHRGSWRSAVSTNSRMRRNSSFLPFSRSLLLMRSIQRRWSRDSACGGAVQWGEKQGDVSRGGVRGGRVRGCGLDQPAPRMPSTPNTHCQIPTHRCPHAQHAEHAQPAHSQPHSQCPHSSHTAPPAHLLDVFLVGVRELAPALEAEPERIEGVDLGQRRGLVAQVGHRLVGGPAGVAAEGGAKHFVEVGGNALHRQRVVKVVDRVELAALWAGRGGGGGDGAGQGVQDGESGLASVWSRGATMPLLQPEK